MAIGIAILADSLDVWGKHRVIVADLTGDASYATGGYAITAAQLGIRKIYGAEMMGGNAVGLSYMVGYNTGTGKIQFFNPTNTTPSVGPATEVVATTNLTTATVRAVFIGE